MGGIVGQARPVSQHRIEGYSPVVDQSYNSAPAQARSHLVPVYYVQVSRAIHLALLSDPESSAQALKLLLPTHVVHTFQRVARHIYPLFAAPQQRRLPS
jgi:hypothetical protein